MSLARNRPSRDGRPTRLAGALVASFALCSAAVGTAQSEDPAAPERFEAVPTDTCRCTEEVWYDPLRDQPDEGTSTESLFAELVRLFSDGRIMHGVERRAERWLRLDAVAVKPRSLELRKAGLIVRSYPGLGGSAEKAVRAEYRLYRRFYLMSETKERGDSKLELRHEVRFW